MLKNLLIALNIILVLFIGYGFSLFATYADDVKVLKNNVIQNSELAETLERVSHIDKSLIKNLPLTQIKTGSIKFDTKSDSSVVNPSGCEANRGLYQHKVVFDKAFSSKPQVSFGLTTLDFRQGADHRLKVEVSDVTKSGFSVNLVTWCDTKISQAKADWIAFYSL